MAYCIKYKSKENMNIQPIDITLLEKIFKKPTDYELFV